MPFPTILSPFTTILLVCYLYTHNSAMKIITRTVWILSLVSLFTDIASEMLYPVMPLFLKDIGYSAVFIGVLEGVAEAIAGISKSYFGKRSDAMGKRLPSVQLGYGFSAISKPLLAFFAYPLWIFFCRTLDRLGKGIRTGARDAMLSDESTAATRGRVFGFHRAMDTLGAVMGPAIALVYLYYHPRAYTTLFVIAFAPGLLALLSTLIIKEKKKPVTEKKEITQPRLFAFFSYWKNSPVTYRKLVMGLLLFALFNSSDVFLLLKMKESGLNDVSCIGIYIFYNLVYALCSYPLGMMADKAGLKRIFLLGLVLFAMVYAGFAFNNSMFIFVLMFAVYGVYAAATEGISKAWISNLVPKNETASAIGTYSGLQSICSLIASSLAGIIWYKFGATAMFISSSIITLIAVGYLGDIKFSNREAA